MAKNVEYQIMLKERQRRKDKSVANLVKQHAMRKNESLLLRKRYQKLMKQDFGMSKELEVMNKNMKKLLVVRDLSLQKKISFLPSLNKKDK